MTEKTQIYWSLNDYCESRCFYCPSTFWNGDKPRDIEQYKSITSKIIEHYLSLDRHVDWYFNGGEPLDFSDFTSLLKICKENGGNIDLTTNGGKIWLDWFAIEPYIDNLHLSFHYWQNYNLIKFIIQTFLNSKKQIEIFVPIRNTAFDDDISRAKQIQEEFWIPVTKQILYYNADSRHGMFHYTEKQLRILEGLDPYDETESSLIQDSRFFKDTTHAEKIVHIVKNNPSYTGKICNAGIEKLYISPQGWVKGSECNDRPLGNIWKDSFRLPVEGHPCGMTVCFFDNDQKITKFT
ncbi:MAG: hypothetical protein EBU90_04695 [Proteobacteria bacterium]|nr:hypothetical protein [Pseudomonadota bacterium]NBP13739.1 hypothetical protein [bacterium]